MQIVTLSELVFECALVESVFSHLLCPAHTIGARGTAYRWHSVSFCQVLPAGLGTNFFLFGLYEGSNLLGGNAAAQHGL